MLIVDFVGVVYGFRGLNVWGANAQPFLCNELVPLQAIFRQFAWALLGKLG